MFSSDDKQQVWGGCVGVVSSIALQARDCMNEAVTNNSPEVHPSNFCTLHVSAVYIMTLYEIPHLDCRWGTSVWGWRAAWLCRLEPA